jgi:hypothetical protein
MTWLDARASIRDLQASVCARKTRRPLDDGPGGYQFQVIGDAAVDLFELMARMVARMRQSLARQHLKDEAPFGLHIADCLVRGRIAWDDEQDGRTPMLVIDGQQISWEQFGRMLMAFEGWQFKLEMLDRSQEA